MESTHETEKIYYNVIGVGALFGGPMGWIWSNWSTRRVSCVGSVVHQLPFALAGGEEPGGDGGAGGGGDGQDGGVG